MIICVISGMVSRAVEDTLDRKNKAIIGGIVRKSSEQFREGMMKPE